MHGYVENLWHKSFEIAQLSRINPPNIISWRILLGLYLYYKRPWTGPVVVKGNTSINLLTPVKCGLILNVPFLKGILLITLENVNTTVGFWPYW